MVYGNQFLNEGKITEKLKNVFDIDKGYKNTNFDYKKLSIEDIDSEDKFRRIVFSLQQEDDEKKKKIGMDCIIRHFLSMILMPVFGIGFILVIINIFLTSKVFMDMPNTSWERIAKRLEERKKKETDQKEIEKLDKMIDKLYDKASEVRDSRFKGSVTLK